MSKLAVKGGNTGTGVFTFVAPNTNIDRTINIPDAGGQLHTSESVNDHASMPTVAGDPIVESGSNSDGEWTRWADGTQKVWKGGFSATTDGASAIYLTPPVSFFPDQLAPDIALVGSLENGSAQVSATAKIEGNVNVLRMRTAYTNTSIQNVSYIAIGRWK